MSKEKYIELFGEVGRKCEIVEKKVKSGVLVIVVRDNGWSDDVVRKVLFTNNGKIYEDNREIEW